MNFSYRNEVARGYMLIFVFYVHSLFAFTALIANPAQTMPFAYGQIKLLEPHIDMFFFLSGMLAPAIGQKAFRSMIPQSFMLLLLAWISQLLGIFSTWLIYGGFSSPMAFVKAAIKPIILGTGDCTYVAWFFTTLAMTRLFVWLFERNKFRFFLACGIAGALIILSCRLGLPDNLWEWRNWPTATAFMLIGMRIPRQLIVPHSVGWSALAGTLSLTWLNTPNFFTSGPCVTCAVNFISEPFVGQYGAPIIFVVQEACFCTFLLWASLLYRPPQFARAAQYFGRSSVQFLLLHGWVITCIYPVMVILLPKHESVILFLGLFVFGPALHAVLFELFKHPLNKVVNWTLKAGRFTAEHLLGSEAAWSRPARTTQ